MGNIDCARRRILVAFLGNTKYQKTTYDVAGKLYTSHLAFLALAEHFAPIEQAYIVGTKDSRWDLLTDYPHRAVFIPFGKNESEFWQIFDILHSQINAADSEVIFDITHCFRAIPLFAVLFLRLLTVVEPSVRIAHVYYGAFEPNQDVTPLVDLMPHVELFDWINSIAAYTNYGELDMLSDKILDVTTSYWKTRDTERPQRLGQFATQLRTFSELSKLTYVPMLPITGKGLAEALQNAELREEVGRYVKPLGLLMNRLREHASLFEKVTLWESQLEAARWYLEMGRPTQSLLVLREAIVTFLCEQGACDPFNLEERLQREKMLNEARSGGADRLTSLWHSVADARNRAGHALMKRPDKNLSVKKAIAQTQRLLEGVEEYMRDHEFKRD